MLQSFGCDIRIVLPSYIGPKNLKSFDDFYEGKDVFDVERKMVKDKFGSYFEMMDPPMKNFTDIDQVLNYDWFSIEWFDFQSIDSQIANINLIRNTGSV